jgi:ankyrin repeat protein
MTKSTRRFITHVWWAKLISYIIVRLVLEAGADRDKADNMGSTPFLVACRIGKAEIARLLVDAGADRNKAS